MGARPKSSAEALRLPDVDAVRLDAVLHAAGSNWLVAIATLVSAIGYIVARLASPAARPVVMEGVKVGFARAVRLHLPPKGEA
ncbi:hypothetical protein ACVFYP_22355 [Roseomonas sp. F4]